MKYVVAFDVVEDAVRYRVVKILLEFGYRVQKSVFECFMSRETVEECVIKLKEVIDAKVDSVRFYPLCKDCEEKVVICGTGIKVEETNYLIL